MRTGSVTLALLEAGKLRLAACGVCCGKSSLDDGVAAITGAAV